MGADFGAGGVTGEDGTKEPPELSFCFCSAVAIRGCHFGIVQRLSINCDKQTRFSRDVQTGGGVFRRVEGEREGDRVGEGENERKGKEGEKKKN